MPSELDVIFGWGTAIIGLLIVAAVGTQVVRALLSNPIPYDTKREFEGKYGRWALETALAVCPHDDIECIEREAKRLSEARLIRR